MTDDRACGGCVACCVYLRIDQPELKKGAMEHCAHLRLANPVEPNVAQYSSDKPEPCSIYEGRPDVCKSYACVWRKGHGTDDDRPDRCGILVDETHDIENAIQAKPLGPGFEDGPGAVIAVQRLCRGTDKVAIVTNFYERKIVRAVGRPL